MILPRFDVTAREIVLPHIGISLSEAHQHLFLVWRKDRYNVKICHIILYANRW